MKFSFNPLEITTYIEEKRLILGKKIENFLIKKLNLFLDYVKLFFNHQFGGLFCCLLIILVSLFKRSMVDIGQDSGLYLEIAQKIFDGKKYYSDFFEYYFLLFFLILVIPVGIAKLFNISPIICAEYFINFLNRANINYVVIADINQIKVDYYKEKLPILKIIKNWIVKDDYENEKPDPKSFYLAKSKYYKYETFIIGIENTIAGYEALKNITPLIYINVQDISTKILFKNKDVFLFNNFNQL